MINRRHQQKKKLFFRALPESPRVQTGTREKTEVFIGFNQLDSVLPEDLFDVFRVKENSLPTAISLST